MLCFCVNLVPDSFQLFGLIDGFLSFFFDTEYFSHLIFFDCLFHFSYNEFLIFLSLI